MKKVKCLEYIKELIKFSPRQLQGEKDTANFLKGTLKKNGLNYKEQKYEIYVPDFKSAELFVDGEKVECDGCGLISGEIKDKSKILSSLISSKILRYDGNINFNPKCPDAFSNSNHYFAPAISVKHSGLNKILSGEKIQVKTEVEKVLQQSENILVGNIENPKNIIFAHYDSVKMGAIDNASGVAVVMSLITEKKELLKDNLFVFSGNEELSYDEEPAYWGYGFRIFEKEYYDLLKNSKKIIPIDSVGNGKNEVIREKTMIMLGFPLNNIDDFVEKISFIAGDFDHLMTVYHSDLDDGRGLTDESLEEAKEILLREVLN